MVKKIKEYKNYCILLLMVIFLIIVANVIYNNNQIYIDVFCKRVRANSDIMIEEQKEYYLSYEFLKKYIDEEIYFDNISKKVVISSEIGLVKIKLNDTKIIKNFVEEDVQKVGVLNEDGIYISCEVLKKSYDIDMCINNNTLYIYENNNFECKLKTNNVKVNLTKDANGKIVDYVDKKDVIIGINETKDYVLVKINGEKVGYIPKEMLIYEKEQEIKGDEKIENKVYIYADNNIKTVDKNLKVDGIFLNMFDITKQSGDISQRNFNRDLFNGFKIYGIITNGYNLAGFNTSIISQVLSDETVRMKVINNLVDKINEYNLEGVVIDFRLIKESDTHNFIQFIKEFKAVTNKKVIVSIDASEYENYLDIINYTDFSIINIYGRRDLNSIVSGSVAEVTWMEQIIDAALKIANHEKIVIGIPAYSILWTEKDSNVINSEIYNLKTIEDYISKNKLEKKYIKEAKQNYIELKKGSLTYKMWIEDEISIKERIKIINDNKLLGVAIYRLGYENDEIINMANTIK